MSPYFENLFKALHSLAFKEESYNKEVNVSMTAFLAISSLIEYSSHDKQDKLEEIILFAMESLEKMISFSEKTREKFLDFQCYHVNVMSLILEKSLKSFKKKIVLKYFTGSLI